MALVIYTGLKPTNVQVFGKWFHFNPGQKKVMDDKISGFLATNRNAPGFVELPEHCVNEPFSEESKKAESDAIKSGRKRLADHYRAIVRNIEVSLQKDFDMNNIKDDARKYATDAELEAYEMLAQLKVQEDDTSRKRLEKIEKLKGIIDGTVNESDTNKTS